jgi:hypothetical protein
MTRRGEVDESDEEEEEEKDEFGMLAVRGPSGAIRPIVPIVVFANGQSETYAMFGLRSVRGFCGNPRWDGAEGDELG